MKKKIYKDLSPLELGKAISKELGVDIYLNSRKPELVDGRALMCYLLRNELAMRWTSIAQLFQSQGKHMDHSNALHLTNQYAVWRKKKHHLYHLEDQFHFTRKPGKEFDKIDYLEKKYTVLEGKYFDLEKKYLDILQKID
tara:strand:+ start:6671 stop:7090 length:420 start_codon:yes stop_codon:yes gene_type:complete